MFWTPLKTNTVQEASRNRNHEIRMPCAEADFMVFSVKATCNIILELLCGVKCCAQRGRPTAPRSPPGAETPWVERRKPEHNSSSLLRPEPRRLFSHPRRRTRAQVPPPMITEVTNHQRPDPVGTSVDIGWLGLNWVGCWSIAKNPTHSRPDRIGCERPTPVYARSGVLRARDHLRYIRRIPAQWRYTVTVGRAQKHRHLIP